MKRITLILSIVSIIIGICFSSCSINKSAEMQMGFQLDSLKNANKMLEQKLDEATAEIDSLKAEAFNMANTRKYSLEIDEMLNIEDTSLFNSNFKQFDIKSVHPRSRQMYQWVSNIHEFGELLQKIEANHSTINNYNTNIDKLPATTIKTLESLNLRIKEDIRTADKLRREKIESSYKDMKKAFAQSQMNYCNELVYKLNNYIDLYFE